jgi:hypothetical protein
MDAPERPAQQDARNQAWRLRARRRGRQLIGYQLNDGKNREDCHCRRRSHKRQQGAVKVEPTPLRPPGDDRRRSQRTQARDDANTEGQKQDIRRSHGESLLWTNRFVNENGCKQN